MKKQILLINLLFFISILSATAQTYHTAHYGPDSQQTLDYYKGNHPNSVIIVVVHGGSWKSGDKEDSNYVNVSQLFNNEGYAVVDIDYRLDTAANYQGFPEQSDDLACAIVWTKLNASTFNGDSGKVVLYGHSAGSQLANLHGLNYTDATLLSECSHTAALNIKAVMSTGCTVDFDLIPNDANQHHWIEKMIGSRQDSILYWTTAQPIHHTSSPLPTKFLLLMGQQDDFVGLPNAVAFYDSLEAYHHCAEFRIFCGRNHKSILGMMSKNDTVFRTMIHFLQTINNMQNCADSATIPCLDSERNSMIAESSEISDLQVYPMPAQNHISVQFSADNAGSVTIKIYNLSGQEMMNTERSFIEGLNEFDLNSGQLFDGVYILELQDHSQLQRLKFIISK